MLELTIRKELPDRPYQRLAEYCQGLVQQKPDLTIEEMLKIVNRYISFMELSTRAIRIMNDEFQLRFKFRDSYDTYFIIKQISINS